MIDRLFLQQNDRFITLDEMADSESEDSQFAHSRFGGSQSQESRPYAYQQQDVETFAFDPNTADSTALLRLGLSSWQVRAIYKYRAKRGRYHRPEDFKRVPGMTPEMYNRLAPYITIGAAFRYYGTVNDRPAARTDSVVRRDTSRTKSDDRQPSSPFSPEKFREMVILDLNTVDTLTLKRVPGIASYRARKIIEYRERLGGYVSVDQLTEIGAIPEDLKVWFTVNTPILRPIAINRDDVGTLSRHPYISYAQARAIFQYRHNFGDITSLTDLSLSNVFTEADLQRLEPYVKY